MKRASTSTVRTVTAGLALSLGLACPASACLEFTLDTVHFHAGRPDFGMLPRRACIRSFGEDDSRPTASDEDDFGERNSLELASETDKTRSENQKARTLRALSEARAQVQAGQVRKALPGIERLGTEIGWSGNLRDCRQVLQEASASRSLSPETRQALQNYLSGMSSYVSGDYTEAAATFQRLYRQKASDSEANALRAHALYQEASVAYELFDFAGAIRLYRQMLHEFPGSTKREAALIMIARCALLPATPAGQNIPEGKKALAQFRREFPQSHWGPAADGLQGRIDLLEHRPQEALRRYIAAGDPASVETVSNKLSGKARVQARIAALTGFLRKLNSVAAYRPYEQSIVAILRISRAMGRAEIKVFYQSLVTHPEVAADYLYYRINHVHNGRADWKRLGQLAETVRARYPALALSPLVRVRLAEVAYHQKRYAAAQQWAERALSAAPDFDRALYVHGSALHKQKRYGEALANFDRLLTRCPASPLRVEAREEAGLLAEQLGNWPRALSEYFALRYDNDIAYLVDARMPLPALEAYLHLPDARLRFQVSTEENESNPHTPGKLPITSRRDLITYSLGIRCMREERWSDAARWFRQLPPATYALFSAGRRTLASKPSPDPLTAIQELSRLQQAIPKARTSEGRADAAFRYASYYHSHGTLLLYNPALWNGGRAFSFSLAWNPVTVSRQDAFVLRSYMYQHEVYGRSLQLCLEVAHRYPRSTAAPKALYRAACASRALASYNGWWREENKRESHWQMAIRLMKEMARRYPSNPLAHNARKYAEVFNQERVGTW